MTACHKRQLQWTLPSGLFDITWQEIRENEKRLTVANASGFTPLSHRPIKIDNVSLSNPVFRSCDISWTTEQENTPTTKRKKQLRNEQNEKNKSERGGGTYFLLLREPRGWSCCYSLQHCYPWPPAMQEIYTRLTTTKTATGTKGGKREVWVDWTVGVDDRRCFGQGNGAG